MHIKLTPDAAARIRNGESPKKATMNRLTASRPRWRRCYVLGILLASAAAAYGQKYEITPLIGGVFGGTWNLEQQGVPNVEAHFGDRLSFGIAGGVRFDGDDADNCRRCNLIEFRWLHQETHLWPDQDPILSPLIATSAFHPRVTLDHFLADFSHEWSIEDSKMVAPFLTASLGAVRMATHEAATARFVFGIGTGVKMFPTRHWGVRFEVEYLPIVKSAELQRVVCVVGCVVALDGGLMNQFQISVGPAFRF